MKTKIRYLTIIPLAFLLIFLSSCSREKQEALSPFGPAGFAILVEMTASPNVLLAGNTRQTCLVTTTVRASDGEPLANRTVIFEYTDWWGNPTDVGYFEGYETVLPKTTNENGIVSVTYYGPLKNEMGSSDTSVYFWATLVHHGREIIKENTSIRIIRND